MGAGYSIRAKANNEAEIFIYEDVGSSFFGGVSAKQFADDLKAIGKVDTIHVRINSYGGDVFDGLAIYRQLVDNKARVVSHIDGVAASIASVIAMAGEEINIAESGQLMIHDAWGVGIGPADDLRRMADQLDATTGAIADVYVARTRNKIGDVRKWMKEETWFIGQEAVDQKFADTVAQNMRIAAHADMSKHKFRNLPASLARTALAASDPARPDYDEAARALKRMKSAITQRTIKRNLAA